MAEKKEYPLMHLGLMVAGLPTLLAVIIIGLLPLALLAAWMRVRMWNWFIVPYFHLPRIGVLLMYVIGLFLSTFRGGTRSLKDEYYANTFLSNWFSEFCVAWVVFGMAYVVHLYWLKG